MESGDEWVGFRGLGEGDKCRRDGGREGGRIVVAGRGMWGNMDLWAGLIKLFRICFSGALKF